MPAGCKQGIRARTSSRSRLGRCGSRRRPGNVGPYQLSLRGKEGAVTQALLQAVEEIRQIIEAHAGSAAANRRLPDAVYDAMERAGLFAMLAPKAYGGLELHPVEAMRVWEAV